MHARLLAGSLAQSTASLTYSLHKKAELDLKRSIAAATSAQDKISVSTLSTDCTGLHVESHLHVVAACCVPAQHSSNKVSGLLCAV